MSRLVLAVLLVCSTAIATDNDQKEYCTSWQDIARAAMTSRQAGVPIKTMLQLVRDETAIGIFKAAYEYPREVTTASQQASVDRFVAFVLSECSKT